MVSHMDHDTRPSIHEATNFRKFLPSQKKKLQEEKLVPVIHLIPKLHPKEKNPIKPVSVTLFGKQALRKKVRSHFGRNGTAGWSRKAKVSTHLLEKLRTPLWFDSNRHN